MILSVCEVPEVLKVMIIIKLIINIIKISVPIILILVCMIEYMKAVKDVDEMKDVNKKIVNKVIATVLIFFIPTLVGIIFRVFDPEGNTYPGCLSIASESRVNELYSNNMENYIKEAETKKDNASIKAARSYLSNIKDPDKREEFDSKLVIIEMDKYMEDARKEKTMATYNKAMSFLPNVKDSTLREKYSNELKSIKSEIDAKNNPGVHSGKKYSLSQSDLIYLTRVCVCEQGTADGAAGEASLIANRYELYGSRYSSIVSYVRNSGWFACSTTSTSYNNSQYEAVKNVFVNGNRKFPGYVDEHDCVNCNSSLCSNGNRGDICKLVTNGTTITSMSSLRNHSNYVSGKTVIYNKYSGVYTFYSFPCSTCDPFGYTSTALQKYNSMNK